MLAAGLGATPTEVELESEVPGGLEGGLESVTQTGTPLAPEPRQVHGEWHEHTW